MAEVTQVQAPQVHPIETVPQTTNNYRALKYLLFQTIVEFRIQRVLETGTDVGDITRILSTALQATGGKLVSVDIVPPKNAWHESWAVKNVDFVTGDATQLAWANELDLLVLDDKHEVEHLTKELDRLGVWVKKGGKIIIPGLYQKDMGDKIFQAVREWTFKHLLCWTAYPHDIGLVIIEVSHQLKRDA